MNPPVDEGDWIVLAREGSSGALARIRLAGGDDTSLDLDLVPGAQISGRVIWDGARPPAMNAIRIFLRGAGEDAAIPPDLLTPTGVVPRADGTFDVSPVFGTVVPEVVPPPGWTVRAVLLGQRDLLDDPLALQSGEAVTGVQVVLSDQVASVTGQVSLPDGSPAAACAIALFPEDRTDRLGPRRMRLARTDQHGRFRMRDVPSGTYGIVAHTDIDPATWMTADSVSALRPRSGPLAVPERGVQEVTLTCQAGP
jgi:hypothetical protein